MLIIALLTIAKTWKQPKHPSTDEQIKIWHKYIMEYYSAMKKNGIMLFAATCMDVDIIILSEISQTKTNTIQCYMWKLKYDTNELIYETETDSQTQKTDLWLPRGRAVLEGWIGSLGLADANCYI